MLFGSIIIGLVNVSDVKTSDVVVKNDAGRFPKSPRNRTNCCLLGR